VGTVLKESCLECRQWALADDDIYCGYCGTINLPLVISEKFVRFITGLSSSQIISIKNLSAKSLTVFLEIKPAECTFLRVSADKKLTIPGSGHKEIELTLLGDRLPPEFSSAVVLVEVVVADRPQLRLPLNVEIVGGPKLLVEPERVSFQNVLEGASALQGVRLSNQGMLPLTVTDVLLEGGAGFSVAAGPAMPLVLDPGKMVELKVGFDSTKDSTQVQSSGRLKVVSKDMPDTHVPLDARVRRAHLEHDPPKVALEPCLARHRHSARIVLRNTGSEEIEVLEVSSPAPWVMVDLKDRMFTLGTDVQGETAMPRQPSEIAFDLILHTADLPSGEHQTTVCVRTNFGHGVDVDIPVRVWVVSPGKESYPEYIGIDFGTTASVVSLYDNSINAARVIEVEPTVNQVTPLIPSVLVMTRPGPESSSDPRLDDYVVGYEAKALAGGRPAETVRSIKRIMGYGNDREILGKTFTPQAIAACIIRRLIDMAELDIYRRQAKKRGRQPHYYPIDKAMVTVPANFFDLQIRAILEACKLAGLDIEEENVRFQASTHASGGAPQLAAQDLACRAITPDKGIRCTEKAGIILDEPSAAAIFYLDKLLRAGSLAEMLMQKRQAVFLIYDHGGGTLDVSVVEVSLGQGASENADIQVRVLANKGNNRVGGDSIDLALMREMVERCARQHPEFEKDIVLSYYKDLEQRIFDEEWSAETIGHVLRIRDTWKDAAEQVKIALSATHSSEYYVDGLSIGRIEDKSYRSGSGLFEDRVEFGELKNFIQGLLIQCQDLVQGALEFAKVDAAQVDYVVHTGRTSLMPLIQENITGMFPGLPPDRFVLNPAELKICVAKGAALYGVMRFEQTESRIRLEDAGRRLPHAYGLGRRAGIQRTLQFDQIIPIGAECPVVSEREFPEGPRWQTFRFYQNSGRNNIIDGNPDIHTLGVIQVDTLSDGIPGCTVRCVVDSNRILEVFVDNQPVRIEAKPMEDDERWIG